jgi:hypothetical protein
MKIIRSSTDVFLYVITHDKSHLMDCGPPDESHLADSSCARISRIFWLLRNGETFSLAATDLFSLFAAILVAKMFNLSEHLFSAKQLGPPHERHLADCQISDNSSSMLGI